ncbi:hypothetical protein ACSBOB_10265 [Mesorhizobium sp. ASY16-5R]|uniref:hypothetical protein n=1 Tax=Mesorhizobium sp. ASY16-5R TaxID=3445772 RepID=UPI003F9F8A82
MTDIPATTTTTRPLEPLRPDFPKPGIGASLAAICSVMGDAFKMAYVRPYATHRRRPQAVADDDLQGRDPGW